jgi:hypothetical protein
MKKLIVTKKVLAGLLISLAAMSVYEQNNRIYDEGVIIN